MINNPVVSSAVGGGCKGVLSGQSGRAPTVYYVDENHEVKSADFPNSIMVEVGSIVTIGNYGIMMGSINASGGAEELFPGVWKITGDFELYYWQ